ncbi:MAG: SpoVR family protein [Thermaerobacter sp.]|nr:SpoVR family protein [Thermaerobacter sp.]
MRRDELGRRAQDLAQEFGLDAQGIQFFRVPSRTMQVLATYGFLGRYGHWSRGKAYHRMRIQANLGLQRFYEVIVNTEPPQAYVLLGNEPIEDVTVRAHVAGHADFFRHNLWMQGLSQGAARRLPLHRRRLHEYRMRYGARLLEETLDRALLLEQYCAPYGPEDVLGAVARGGSVEGWQRECLEIVREEGVYFRAQQRTKILNEGWATFWHLRIMRALDLPPAEYLEFAALHSQIVALSPGRFNPYALGLALLEEIAAEHGGAPGDVPGSEVLQTLCAVRAYEDDTAFLRNHLSQRAVDRLGLSVRSGQGAVRTATVEEVRTALLLAVSSGSRPQVEVEQADPGLTLRLRHLHDGRDLDLPEAEAVLGEIQAFWGPPVQIETAVAGQRVVLRHDGSTVTRRTD